MNKIMKIHVTYEDGEEKIMYRPVTKWLFISQTDDHNIVSLSGNDEKNAFLLKMLDVFISQEIMKGNKIR